MKIGRNESPTLLTYRIGGVVWFGKLRCNCEWWLRLEWFYKSQTGVGTFNLVHGNSTGASNQWIHLNGKLVRDILHKLERKNVSGTRVCLEWHVYTHHKLGFYLCVNNLVVWNTICPHAEFVHAAMPCTIMLLSLHNNEHAGRGRHLSMWVKTGLIGF